MRDGVVNSTSIALLRTFCEVVERSWLYESEKQLLERAANGTLQIGRDKQEDTDARSDVERRWAVLSS